MLPTPVCTSGDKVYTFNGTSDFDKINNSDAINFGTNDNFTVAVWIKAESQQKDTGNADNDVVEKWISGSGPYPYVIRYLNQKAGNNSGIIVAARYDGSNNPSVRSTSKINDGKFHHLAFVRSTEANQGQLSLYIDGFLEGTAKDTTTGNTKNSSPIYLGCRGVSDRGMNYFTGSIKGLSIYNVALSAEQIQAVVHLNTGMKVGPVGNSLAGTDFDIQPKTDAPGSRIKRILLRSGYALDRMQIEYENPATTPPATYLSEAAGGDGGNPGEFILDADDYITEVIGSWAPEVDESDGRRIIPPAIVTIQFKTNNGVTSPVWGGEGPDNEVEPFSFKAPEGYQIIGFFGACGDSINCLVRLGVYLKPVSVTPPKVTTYLIKSKLNGLALGGNSYYDVKTGAVDSKSPSQQWSITADGVIKNQNGFVLDYQDFGIEYYGVKYYVVMVNPMQGTNGSPSQQWIIENGVIENKHNPNLVMDIAGNNPAPNTTILAAPYNGGLNQQWELVAV